MPTHQDILTALTAHLSHVLDEAERHHTSTTIEFITRTPLAFTRDHAAGGHVGPSAVVLSADRQHILLTHHKVEHKWALIGSHCDSNSTLPEIARQRIAKDAGEDVARQCITDGKIIDVDIHHVPAHQRGNDAVPDHLHYDIAYLFTIPELTPPTSMSRWFTLAEAVALPRRDAQFKRIIAKIAPEISQ